MSKLSIKIIGTLIVIIFFFIIALNILPNTNNTSNNSVISDDNDKNNAIIDKTNAAKIISLGMENDKLKLVLDDGVSEYCVKTTKTKPSVNSICFKRVDNNIVYTSIYKYKKYYIWTKDYSGNISDYISVDSRKIDK